MEQRIRQLILNILQNPFVIVQNHRKINKTHTDKIVSLRRLNNFKWHRKKKGNGLPMNMMKSLGHC